MAGTEETFRPFDSEGAIYSVTSLVLFRGRLRNWASFWEGSGPYPHFVQGGELSISTTSPATGK